MEVNDIEGLNDLLDEMGEQENCSNQRALMSRWRKIRSRIEHICAGPQYPDGEMKRLLVAIYGTLRWRHFSRLRRIAWRRSDKFKVKRKKWDATYYQKRNTEAYRVKKRAYDKARYAGQVRP